MFPLLFVLIFFPLHFFFQQQRKREISAEKTKTMRCEGIFLLVYSFIPLTSIAGKHLTCFHCIKTSPACPPFVSSNFPCCSEPFYRSNKVVCRDENENCVAATRYSNGKELNIFTCGTCKDMYEAAPHITCFECDTDCCNSEAPMPFG